MENPNFNYLDHGMKKVTLAVKNEDHFNEAIKALSLMGVKTTKLQQTYEANEPYYVKRPDIGRTVVGITVVACSSPEVKMVIRNRRYFTSKNCGYTTSDISEFVRIIKKGASLGISKDSVTKNESAKESEFKGDSFKPAKLSNKDIPFKIKSKDICSDLMSIINGVLDDNAKISCKDIASSHGITIKSNESIVVHMSESGYKSSSSPEIEIKKETKKVVREVSYISGFSFPEREARNKEINEIKAQMAKMMEKLNELEG